MSEESEQRDYEALNAKTALDLNKAQQEIERLTAEIARMNHAAHAYDGAVERLEADNERLRAVYDAAKHLATKAEYGIGLHDWAALYVALAAVEQTDTVSGSHNEKDCDDPACNVCPDWSPDVEDKERI